MDTHISPFHSLRFPCMYPLTSDMIGSKTNKKTHSAKDPYVKRNKGTGPKATKEPTKKRKGATKQKSKRTTIDKIKKIASSYGVPLTAVAAAILYALTQSYAETTTKDGHEEESSPAARAGSALVETVQQAQIDAREKENDDTKIQGLKGNTVIMAYVCPTDNILKLYKGTVLNATLSQPLQHWYQRYSLNIKWDSEPHPPTTVKWPAENIRVYTKADYDNRQAQLPPPARPWPSGLPRVL